MKSYDKNIFKGEQFVQKNCKLHSFMLPFFVNKIPQKVQYLSMISPTFLFLSRPKTTHMNHLKILLQVFKNLIKLFGIVFHNWLPNGWFKSIKCQTLHLTLKSSTRNAPMIFHFQSSSHKWSQLVAILNKSYHNGQEKLKICNNTIGRSMDVNVRMKMQFALNFAFVSIGFYTIKNQKVTFIIFHTW